MPTLNEEFVKAKNDGCIPNIDTFSQAIRNSRFQRQDKIITLCRKLIEKITENLESDERTNLDKFIQDLRSSDPDLYSEGQSWIKTTLNGKIFGSSIMENTFPVLGYFVKNFDPGEPKNIATLDIALWKTGSSKITFDNISSLKLETRRNDKERWPDGRRTEAERQAGVSILGAQSEYMIQESMSDLVDDTNLMKTIQDQISSYGDFVLMCLPNNLWFSVKSGYARERLLASGFSNDLIGVGFFEKQTDLISPIKTRHLKKAGFLAVYLPDFPVNDEQVQSGLNTYDEGIESFGDKGVYNINGTPFYRKFSALKQDIKKLTDQNLKNRFTTDF